MRIDGYAHDASGSECVPHAAGEPVWREILYRCSNAARCRVTCQGIRDLPTAEISLFLLHWRSEERRTRTAVVVLFSSHCICKASSMGDVHVMPQLMNPIHATVGTFKTIHVYSVLAASSSTRTLQSLLTYLLLCSYVFMCRQHHSTSS